MVEVEQKRQQETTKLEKYFEPFRKNIIGHNAQICTPFKDDLRMVYADWTASGRCYQPIEDRISREIMPLLANTHTETSSSGQAMTLAYHQARNFIKKHVNAGPDDVLISCASGMTGVVNKFQRILGLRLHERYKEVIQIPEKERPIIFVTHMEHHSNQTSWLETICDVAIIDPCPKGRVNLDSLYELLEKYKDRTHKIAAITSCSNVTGLFTPYSEIAKIMHQHGGLCFVDFACSAPYIDINMHPADSEARLDAIYFSPHKFLGGPGTTGVLVFDGSLYDNKVPDNPGGGTVEWTNPWGIHRYSEDIETREDGGTPAFLQTIKTALALQLKEEMGVDNILRREKEIMQILWDAFESIPNLHVLAGEHRDRLGVFSFFIEDLHFNVGVKLLNDRFGIQSRGGCSCAGTYGHYLLEIQPDRSVYIWDQIKTGDFSLRPGWIRLSIHPTMSNEEVKFIAQSVKDLAENFEEWQKEYNLEKCATEVQVQPPLKDTFIQERVQRFFRPLEQF